MISIFFMMTQIICYKKLILSEKLALVPLSLSVTAFTGNSNCRVSLSKDSLSSFGYLLVQFSQEAQVVPSFHYFGHVVL